MLRQKALSKLTSRDAVALALQKNQSLQAARAAIDTSRCSIPNTRGGSTTLNSNWDMPPTARFNDEGEQSYTIGFEQRFPITNRLKLLKNVSAIEVKLAEAELRNQERLLIRDVESATRTHFKLEPAPDLSWMSMISLQEGLCGLAGKTDRKWRGIYARFESSAGVLVFG